MIVSKYVYPKDVRRLRITAMGDFHLGHLGCDKQKLLTDLKWVARQKNMLVFLMGDYLDNCIPYITKESHHVYYEIDPDLPTFTKGYSYLQWLLAPISEQIIGIHQGNHDLRFIRKTTFNYVEQLAHDLGIPYLAHEALTRLQVASNHKCFDIYSVHGSYGGRRTGGKLNRLEDIAASFEADIYLMGHTHDLGGWRTVRLRLQEKKGELQLLDDKKVFAFTGTYFRSHVVGSSSYAERRQYRPSKLGLITIEINPRRRDLHVKE